MKSLVLSFLMMISIETAVWINMVIPYFTGKTSFHITYLIISSVQLGATVDYAILLTDRYRELREILNKKGAIINMLSAVLVSILNSASALTVVGF